MFQIFYLQSVSKSKGHFRPKIEQKFLVFGPINKKQFFFLSTYVHFDFLFNVHSRGIEKEWLRIGPLWCRASTAKVLYYRRRVVLIPGSTDYTFILPKIINNCKLRPVCKVYKETDWSTKLVSWQVRTFNFLINGKY